MLCFSFTWIELIVKFQIIIVGEFFVHKKQLSRMILGIITQTFAKKNKIILSKNIKRKIDYKENICLRECTGLVFVCLNYQINLFIKFSFSNHFKFSYRMNHRILCLYTYINALTA
jgi:hypothetical protein